MKVKNIIPRACFIVALASGPLSDVALAASWPSNKIPDNAITNAIEREFVSDKSVKGNFMDVQTADGVVTLSGTADNMLAEKRAIALTKEIKGVEAVVDEMKVIPERRSDEQVSEDVTKTLANDPAARHYAIKVGSKEGVITLTGNVSSWVEKHLAETVTEAVRGVKSINNEIVVTSQPGWVKRHLPMRLIERAHGLKRVNKDDMVLSPINLSDEELRADIVRLLGYDPRLDGATIETKVIEGNAVLSGTVGSLAEKSRAEDDARSAGAATVKDSDLVVDWIARNKMQQSKPLVFKTDQEVEMALTEALIDDPRVAAFQTHSGVEAGIVVLSGVVDNLEAKKAAEEDARNTMGVWGVQNYIKVRPIQIPGDSELTTRVNEALQRNPLTALAPLSVRATHGRVFLSGVVDTDYMKETAADVVYRVPGVVGLENNLIIAPDVGIAAMDDWEIKEDTEERFGFSPRLDSSNIQVRVVDGIVTLSGGVDNGLARRTAIYLARRAGARSVHDELKVKTAPPASPPSEHTP